MNVKSRRKRKGKREGRWRVEGEGGALLLGRILHGKGWVFWDGAG